VLFGGGGWFVLLAKLVAVFLVDLGVLGWQDGNAAGEAVGERVLRGAEFAVGRARSGGIARVGAVDGSAVFGRICWSWNWTRHGICLA